MPSTYTPNLGFEKVEPGEQTGTWGGTLNTNFDLIGEAITGLGAVALPSEGTSGSPNQIQIVDGTSSDARNAFIEFTDGGGVTGDAYVQYGPSDSQKLMWVRNSMGNGFNLIFFQGSYNAGRAYTVADGDTVLMMFTGQGAAASYASAVMTNVVLEGFKLPNNTAISWDNAAGDDTLDIKLDASDDLIVTLNSTDILQYDSSATTFDFKANDLLTTGDLSVGGITATGSISASNLSGTNTGDEPTFAGSTEGLVPTSVGGTTNYLRADGTWAEPPGGSGYTSPVTTKGDIFTYDTDDARLPVGTNGQVLSANSTTATGLEWITVDTGGLGNVVEDTTPQLGGDLDSNNFNIALTNTGTAKELRFYEPSGGGTSYAALKAPSLGGTYTLTLPTTDGASGEFLKTDGSGNLSWDTPTGGTYGVAAIYMVGTTDYIHPDTTASSIRALIGAGTGSGDITSVEVIAGEGLTGGGIDYSGSVSLTVNMGTPGDLSGSSTSATTADSHTHAVTFDEITVVGAPSDVTMYPVLTGSSASGTYTPYVDNGFQWNASTNELYVQGTIKGYTLDATSARWLKNQVDGSIDPSRLEGLNPILYVLKDDEQERKRMGYFADEVEALFPEIVGYDDEGRPSSIDYSRLVVPLIMKVNELSAEVERLRWRV